MICVQGQRFRSDHMGGGVYPIHKKMKYISCEIRVALGRVTSWERESIS